MSTDGPFSDPPPPFDPTAAVAVPANSVRGPEYRAGMAAEGDDSAPAARAVLRDSGAFPQNGPAVAIMPPSFKAKLDALEALWLADQGLAPFDDQAAAQIQTTAPEAFPLIFAQLAGRDPRFLRAVLLRGVSRLWADGPNSNPQKP